MQALAVLVGGLFIGLVEWFAKYFSKKLAIMATLITFITVLTATFIGATEALISTVSVNLPSQATVLIGGVMPSNMNECISVVLAARISRFVYEMNVRFAEYMSVS